jgi:sporulation protein YlmC with PRC-barrel domain
VSGKLKWISIILALLVMVAMPGVATAQGGPGQGNPPPGQVKEKGAEGNNAQGPESNNGQQGQGAPPAATDPQAQEPRFINVRAERLLGLPIIDIDGDVLGEIGDILVNITGQRQSADPKRPARGGLIANGRVDYALVQFGGVLGLGEESVPVPLTALRLHLVDGARLGFDDDLLYFEGTAPGDDEIEARTEFFDRNAMVLMSEQQDLDTVPKFDLDGLSDATNPDWDRNLRAYWQGLGAAMPEVSVGNGAVYRVTGVRELNRFGLRELGGDRLGSVDDVLLTLALANPVQAVVPPLTQQEDMDDKADRDNILESDDRDENRRGGRARALAAALPIVDARAHYALVGHGGWWGWGVRTIPVPFNTLMMDRSYDKRTLYLEADDELVEDAPALDGDEEDELNDENFFTRVRAYWEEAGFGAFEQ